jgi:hypothetical protein
MLSTRSKARLGARAAKGLARNEGIRDLAVGSVPAITGVRFGWRKRRAKKRGREQVERLTEAARTAGDAARSAGETLQNYAPQVAQQLGLAEPPKQKRTAPRVAAGVVIGASAVYFLEPQGGAERRRQVQRLVSVG